MEDVNLVMIADPTDGSTFDAESRQIECFNKGIASPGLMRPAKVYYH